MKPLFGTEGRRVLREFAWSNVLLAFDFDGTLAPIVKEPGAARMRPTTSAAFRQLCDLYPCVVISGRAHDDVSARLDGARVRAVVGNHGIEASSANPRYSRRVREWLAFLQPLADAHPGLALEDKGYSLAVHYRRVRRKREALSDLRTVLSKLGPVRELPGKQVVNLLPPGAPHKGDAVQTLRKELRADTAIFVGDDVTDEDAFAIADREPLLPVRVGRKLRSAAWYYLPRQPDIDLLLKLLAQEARACSAIYG